MTHKDYLRSPVFHTVLDSGQSTDNSLSIGDFVFSTGCLLEGTVKINTDEHSLVLKKVGDFIDCKFSG